jgi:TonB family protein
MLGLLPITAAPLLGAHGATNFAPYGQSVQTAIDQRLQEDPSVHGRAFAAVLRVNVRADGALHLASLARSTGDAAMDRAIAAAVNGAVAPRSPPDGMPQPIWFELTSHR